MIMIDEYALVFVVCLVGVITVVYVSSVIK